jgi:hypothetical protein
LADESVAHEHLIQFIAIDRVPFQKLQDSSVVYKPPALSGWYASEFHLL